MKYGLASLGLAGLSQPVFPENSHYGIVGREAPELRVDYWLDSKGEPREPFQLSLHQGKWVLLKCFQNWCPGCHSHGLPALKKMSDALADNPKVAFAGIQTVFEGSLFNTQSKVLKIQQDYDLKIPMGHDPGDERSFTMMDYRTGGTPWMILIDPSRRVVFNDFGLDADKAIEYLKEQTKA